MDPVKETILKAQATKTGLISVECCIKWYSVTQESVCMYQVITHAQTSTLPRANAASGAGNKQRVQVGSRIDVPNKLFSFFMSELW